MKLVPEYCIGCSMQQVIRNGKAAGASDSEIERVMKLTMKYIADNMDDITPAHVATFFNRIFKENHPQKDPYIDIKKKHNEEVMEIIPAIEKEMDKSNRPVQFSLKCAAIGNSIDMGIFEEIDVNELIEEIKNKELSIDNSDEIERRLKGEKQTILYICDNAGEIGFDTLFIKYASSLGHDVYTCVKGGPILNDATVDDAIQVGLNKYSKIITTGIDELGVVMDHTSDEFKNIFNKADIVISKGHANFETLYGIEREIFFILKTKCTPVANYCGVDVNSIIIKRMEKGAAV